MRESPPAVVLTAVAVIFTATVFIVAAYLIAGTPSDVLRTGLVEPQQAPGERETVEYTIAEGASAADVAADLEELGIIRSARQFQVLISLMGLQDQLSAGDHILQVGSSTPTVISMLTVREMVPVLRVTFPEGLRIEEMAEIAEEAGFWTAEEFLEAAAEAELPDGLAEALPPADQLPEGQRLQGYLFPDTYIRPVGFTAEELVNLMIETLDERFTPEMREAAAERGMTTHEILTMASIIEREAAVADERPVMAGVFYNRLEANDVIGADPTVQFAVSLQEGSVEEYGYWKPELTVDDLEIQSPYNTREMPGLPPGPIASPGLASIQAAVEPADTDYYYFVANAREGDGSHVFAETFAEHQQNIAEYLE